MYAHHPAGRKQRKRECDGQLDNYIAPIFDRIELNSLTDISLLSTVAPDIINDTSETGVATVRLEPVCEGNWRHAIALNVFPNQSELVPPVVFSLAEAYVKPDGRRIDPYVITAFGQVVGFLRIRRGSPHAQDYSLGGFLIGAQFQRQGYGTAALRELISLVPSVYPDCAALSLSVQPQNHVARKLYASFGFSPTGVRYEDEIEYELRCFDARVLR